MRKHLPGEKFRNFLPTGKGFKKQAGQITYLSAKFLKLKGYTGNPCL